MLDWFIFVLLFPSFKFDLCLTLCPRGRQKNYLWFNSGSDEFYSLTSGDTRSQQDCTVLFDQHKVLVRNIYSVWEALLSSVIGLQSFNV